MNLISSQAPGGAVPAVSCTHRSSLKFTNPIPPLFSNLQRPSKFPATPTNYFTKPLTVAKAEPFGQTTSSSSNYSSATDTRKPNSNGEENVPITLVGEQDVPLEGVIQLEKPSSSFPASLVSKWGRVGLLAGGDVLALVLFSTIGRFSHGFAVFDFETLRTADPFIAGWFLSAYFLGGYGEDGRGINGRAKAITVAAKSWALGVPLGIIIRAASLGHIPAINFIIITMGSTAVLLIGWRTLVSGVNADEKSKQDDDYRRGSPFELFELLTSLIRRW